MNIKFYASSNASNYGISQTLTLEQLGLEGCEDSDDFEICKSDFGIKR